MESVGRLSFPPAPSPFCVTGRLTFRIQQAEEPGGRPLAPDLIAFLRSRLTP